MTTHSVDMSHTSLFCIAMLQQLVESDIELPKVTPGGNEKRYLHWLEKLVAVICS